MVATCERVMEPHGAASLAAVQEELDRVRDSARLQQEQHKREVKNLRTQLEAATAASPARGNTDPVDLQASSPGGSAAIRFEVQAQILYKTALELELLREAHGQVRNILENRDHSVVDVAHACSPRSRTLYTHEHVGTHSLSRNRSSCEIPPQALSSLSAVEGELGQQKYTAQQQQKQHEREVLDLREQLATAAANVQVYQDKLVQTQASVSPLQEQVRKAELDAERLSGQVQQAVDEVQEKERQLRHLRTSNREFVLESACEQYKHIVKQLEARVAELQGANRGIHELYEKRVKQVTADLSSRLHNTQASVQHSTTNQLREVLAAGVSQVEQYLQGLQRNMKKLESGWRRSVTPASRASQGGPAEAWLQEADWRHQRCTSELDKIYSALRHLRSLKAAPPLEAPGDSTSDNEGAHDQAHHTDDSSTMEP